MSNNKKIDTPSSFWGIGGMALTLLSLAATVLLVATAGAVIGGLVVGLLGITAGLVCMGIGVAKNSSAIEDIAKKKSVSTVNGMSVHIGYTAEKQQNTEKRKDNSQTNNINSENACISKEQINNIKSQSLNK